MTREDVRRLKALSSHWAALAALSSAEPVRHALKLCADALDAVVLMSIRDEGDETERSDVAS